MDLKKTKRTRMNKQSHIYTNAFVCNCVSREWSGVLVTHTCINRTHAMLCYPFIKYSTNRRARLSEFSTNTDVNILIYIYVYKHVGVYIYLIQYNKIPSQQNVWQIFALSLIYSKKLFHVLVFERSFCMASIFYSGL